MDGHIAQEKCAFASSPSCSGVVKHVLHGDVSGVGETQDDHPERVADKEEINSCFVEQSSSGVVVGGEGRNRFLRLVHPCLKGRSFIESSHGGRFGRIGGKSTQNNRV